MPASRYPIPSRYIEQKVQDGTAGAVNLARPHVHEPGADHLRGHGVRGGSHPDQPYRRRRDHLGQGGGGLPALRRGGDRRQGLHDPHRGEAERRRSAKLANIGLYYIRAVDSLWQGIDHVLARPKNKGEYFLTDAFQWMIEHGKRILTAEVGGWYDCGAPRHTAGDQRDPAAQGCGPAGGLSRRHHPRSGVHRGRGHHRAERDRAQRLHRARHQDRGSRMRNTIVGRDAVSSPTRRSTARCWAIACRWRTSGEVRRWATIPS